DIIDGFNRSFVVSFTSSAVQQPDLHLLWDRPLTVPMFAVLRPTSPANTNGFALMPGFIANLTVSFPVDWGRASDGSDDGGDAGGSSIASKSTTTIVLLCPPHPDFNIFAGEAVDLYLDTSLITAGRLCQNEGDSGSAATSSSPSALGIDVFLMLINTP